MNKKAIIVVDIQNDYFPGGKFGLSGVEAAADHAARVIDHTDVVVVGNMSHMCIDAVTRSSDDFGYATTVIHDACATRDLSFDGVDVPAHMVHAAFMAALAFGYAKVISTNAYVSA